MEIRYIAAAAALSAALALHAQSNAPLRGTVEVDGKFLPDVIRQDKVNTLPRLYSVPLETSTLENTSVSSSRPVSMAKGT